jgi:hypothetical protein
MEAVLLAELDRTKEEILSILQDQEMNFGDYYCSRIVNACQHFEFPKPQLFAMKLLLVNVQARAKRFKEFIVYEGPMENFYFMKTPLIADSGEFVSRAPLTEAHKKKQLFTILRLLALSENVAI